jgi:hypothetical protein
MRYWITVDRETHLTAHLAAGEGLVEATEEQTLVALGELAVTEPVAVAAVTPATKPGAAAAVGAVAKPATDLTVDQAAQKKRVIGKAAADTRVVMEEAPVAPSVAGSAPTLGEAVATPEVTLDQEVVAKPGLEKPVVAEKPVVEKPVEKPVVEKPVAEDKPAEPEQHVEKPVVPEKPKSGIDNATLNGVVAANRPAVLKCFAEGKKQNPNLKGTLSLTLGVDAKGKVARVQVSSTITGASLVSACLVKSAYGWKFPASGVALSMVTYPFTINYGR